jgi:hypothetical protein
VAAPDRRHLAGADLPAINQGTIDRIYRIGVEALRDLTRSTYSNLDAARFPDKLQVWVSAVTAVRR